MIIFFLLYLQTKSVIIYVNETIQYPLTDYFGYLENPTYEIMDLENPYLSIIPQFNLHLDTQTHSQNASVIIQAKPQTYNDLWTNHFFFLELNNGTYNLHYSENPQYENEATPKFNDHLLVTDSESDICYDAEQLNLTHYIVDCAVQKEGQPLENKLLFVSKDKAVITQNVSNPLQYQSIKKRKISFLIRKGYVQIFIGFMQSEEQSIIQRYGIGISGTIYEYGLEESITSSLLQRLFKFDSSFKFHLLDFKIVNNKICILDENFFGRLILDIDGDLRKDYYLGFEEKVIAFDFVSYLDNNGNTSSRLALLKMNSFDLYYYEKVTYNLITPVSANAQIKISQQFILIQDENTIYQYRFDQRVLINKKQIPEAVNFLINPIHPVLISVNQSMTQKYSFSEGYLKVQSKTSVMDPTVYTIRATTQSKSYNFKFTLQILSKNDGYMYQNGRSKQIIADAIYKADETQDVIPFVSAPNIEIGVGPSAYFYDIKNFQKETQNNHYDQYLQNNPYDIEFEIIQEMHIQEWPNQDTIHFQDMLKFNDTLVYVFFQLKNLTIQLWKCNLTIDDLVTSCMKDPWFWGIYFQILISKVNFQWWIDYKVYYFAYFYQETGAYVEIYELTGNYRSYTIGSQIPLTQILLSHGKLFILSAKEKKIEVWNLKDKILYTIDEETVKSSGMIKSWSPRKIFGNQKLTSCILFIQNNDNLMVTIEQNQISLVKNIKIPDDDIEITFDHNSFFLIRISSGQSILEQYSIKYLNNIYLMRQVQLYDYEFYQPLKVIQSKENGFLFILTKSQQILLFRPNEENSNDLLFRVFSLQLSDFMTMSAFGSIKTHFYFNNGSNSTYFAILTQTKMVMKSLIPMPTDQYFTAVTLQFYFKNKQYQYDFGEKIAILNRNQNFTLYNQENISIPKDESFYSVTLNNLYSGQVISLSCDNCDSRIQLINPLQILRQTQTQYYLRDIQQYSVNQKMALAGSGKLLLIDNEGNMKELVSFEYRPCIQLQIQKNSTYILVLCIDDDEEIPQQFQLVTCDLEFNCEIQDVIQDLKDINKVKKMVLLLDNLILVLDMEKILVYFIQILEDTWSITLTQIIQNEEKFTDFIVQEYDEEQKHYYIITMIDQSKYLNVIFAEFLENKLNILSDSSISIENAIRESNYFASKSMDYIRLLAISKENNQELNYILISNNEASVAIKIFLNDTKQIQGVTATNFFIPYSNWSATGLAAQYGKWLIIAYDDYFYYNYVLALYSLNNTQEIQNFQYGLVTHGCYVPLIYSLEEASFSLFSCDNYRPYITRYEVRNYPELKFNETSYLQPTQTITLTANNILKWQSIKITVQKEQEPQPNPTPDPIPDPTPEDDKLSGINLSEMILIGVGSASIIGIGIVIYMKYKQIGFFKGDRAGYYQQREA